MSVVIQFPTTLAAPISEASFRVCWIDVGEPDIVLGAWFNEEMMAATLYAQLAPSENVARVEAAFQRGDGTWEPWEP